MTTLKEHQAAMVDLLANGSGIPASASRLAHAMHDVLEQMTNAMGSFSQIDMTPVSRAIRVMSILDDATTPGLNEKALSKPVATLKTDSPAKWPASAESRIKELENTIRQLRGSNKVLRYRLDCAENEVMRLRYIGGLPEQAELVKLLAFYGVDDLDKARAEYLKYSEQPEQAGVRKEDTQVCEHEYKWDGVFMECTKCRDIKL